jgi:hypothetical protein
VTVIVFDLMLYEDKKDFVRNEYIPYVDFYLLKKKRRINQMSRFELSNNEIFFMFTRKQLE